ncbi:MAG: patatin-like phospholipase family protein [Pseudomonadota bacterium]
MQIRPFMSVLISLILVLSLCCALPVAAETPPNRISLAISGGASMGAYEAGLIWGLIDVLRQTESAKDWAPGGAPKPIEISSIAGASAGGINTLLAALAWSVNTENRGGFANRIDDNIFRDVWLTPDVNRLLPPTADSPQYSPDDALLSRKDLVAVAWEVAQKWRRPGTFRPGLRVPLGLTVTRVKPDTMLISGIAVENQRFFIPLELRTRADGSASFFFDPGDYPSLTDPAMILMPWPVDGTPFSISDQQVVDALMTTSAFPGGFGRKRLQYCRKKIMSPADGAGASSPAGTGGKPQAALVCPDGYSLEEAEFADGGLFDNLPIGLARRLSESSAGYRKKPLPVQYIYLDPNRERYETAVPEEARACGGENPPEACRTMTHDFGSETVVLGGAIGTARRYELYRELTSDNWRLNLSQLSRQMADAIDANRPGMRCDSELLFFDEQPGCSDRLRYAARLMALTHSHRIVPIRAPLSEQALLKADIAVSCQPPPAAAEPAIVSDCTIDASRLRRQLADTLVALSAKVLPEEANLKNDIRRSAMSPDSDRLMHVTSRGGPITALLLDSFGAFLDYKFREYDYFVGVSDAIMALADSQCEGNYPGEDQHSQRQACRDRLSQQFFTLLGMADNPKSRYAFALVARQEFGKEGGLRWAYDPMPPEDRDTRIIFEGLSKTYISAGRGDATSDGLLSTERVFFEFLKAEGFKPAPSTDGGASLLTAIMADPEYWSTELVDRATARLVYLEKQSEAVYRAREPDPVKQEKANTGLMGAGALALRTATYKYPPFSFSPSTAPDSWFWRNIIPYEAAFDLSEGDILVFWQPTWRIDDFTAGVRMGLGFTGGLFKSNTDAARKNYGVLGLDLTKMADTWIFSGWGITPAAYHDWENPATGDQTTFGLDVHANLLKNRLRIGFGARDIVHRAGDTLFLTVSVLDLPGLVYWLGQ